MPPEYPPATVAAELFRSGLLEGQAIVLAAGAGPYGAAAAGPIAVQVIKAYLNTQGR